jgi:hypothetical protein
MSQGELDGDGVEHGPNAGETPLTYVQLKSLAEAEARKAKDAENAPYFVYRLREAWGYGSLNFRDRAARFVGWPVTYAYVLLADAAVRLSLHPWYVRIVTLTIIAAGTVVGIQTEIARPGNDRSYPIIGSLDEGILAIFLIDVVVKLVAEGLAPLHYFSDSWNCFDFTIVAACYVFKIPAIESLGFGSLIAMLRLMRLLRVLKLVKALPQLRIIVEALIAGFGSISFVTVILFIFFYLYANIGMIFFAANDPAHFGNLQLALISLFRLATLDGWSDIM